MGGIYKRSQVFGDANVVLETALKSPNQYREAVIFESLSNMSHKKIKEFLESEEAKTMLTTGSITQDTIDRLSSEVDNGCLQTTVMQMAKDEQDPLWDEFVRCRIQERRLMNDLMEKYAEKAKPVAEQATKDYVDTLIPEYFRQ